MAHPQPSQTNGIIGSVMPLALPVTGLAEADSVWDHWTAGKTVSAYQTARSALAALLSFRGVRRILLPAYVCDTLVDAGVAAGCEVDFYPVHAALEADAAALQRQLRPGDAVLAIDYFGRPADATLVELSGRRRDILWIEDRAQALDPGAAAWGDVVLYSPRKLLGVADGGLLAADGELPVPDRPEDAPDEHLWTPQVARLEDPEDLNAGVWFAASQAREQGFQVCRRAMSERTARLLKATPIARETEARRRNFSILAERLSGHGLWPSLTDPAFAPLAFPLLADDCEAVRAYLADHRIYCARHWADLPSPADRLPDAHRIAQRCLSLPCEPRYSPQDMRRVAETVLDALRTRR